MKNKEDIENNEWEDSKDLDKVVDFVKKVSKNEFNPMSSDWTWIRNSRCKYISIKIDMRDGAFIITDRSGKRITFDQLKDN